MATPMTEEPKPETVRLLLEAMEIRRKNYRMELKRCRAKFSHEAVHDLRVATRRMLAIIQLLNSIFPRPRLQKLTRTFKNQLNEFNDLRDTQVILAEIAEIIHELPQLQDFQKYLQFTEERLLRSLRKKIKQLEPSEVSKRIRKTYEAIETETNSDLRPQIMQTIDDVYLITKHRQGWIDITCSATIHRVRIAFKSFRYMVEIVHPLLNGFPMENLKRMNNYQSLMGEIQDAEVFAQNFADFSERASFPNVEPVHHYCERRHAGAISAYVEAKEHLDTFWRPAPDKHLPWEKTE